MGDYVYGSGEVTLKKELSAVNFSQMQEGLKKKKDDLDMVGLYLVQKHKLNLCQKIITNKYLL